MCVELFDDGQMLSIKVSLKVLELGDKETRDSEGLADNSRLVVFKSSHQEASEDLRLVLGSY